MGDPVGVIWRTFQTFKPNVYRGHDEHEFGSSSLRNEEFSKTIRMTEVIKDANSATDYLRPVHTNPHIGITYFQS